MLNAIHRVFVVDIPLPIAWAHLAQVERWPTWAKHIKHVELNPKGDLTLNTVGSFHLTNGIRSDFRMTEIHPLQNWKWVGPFLWLMIHYDHIFERVDERHTKLIWTVGAEGFGVSLFGRLFAVIYNRNLDKAIPRLIGEMNTLKK